MGRSTENSYKRSNSASPDSKANKTPKLQDDGCSLSLTGLIEAKFREFSESFGSKLTSVSNG